MNASRATRSVAASSARTDRASGLSLYHALLKSLDGFEDRLQLCARSFSSKRVHDVRVAARRFSVVLKELRKLRLLKGTGKLRAAVRYSMKQLSELRDLQVHKGMLRESGGILFEKLVRKEARVKKRSLRAFNKCGKRLMKRLGKFRDRMQRNEAKLRQYSVIVAAQVRRALTSELAGLAAQASTLDGDNPRKAHKFRLAIKRFRYRRELLAFLSPQSLDSLAQPLKDMQNLTGSLHDIDELLDRIGGKRKRVECAALFDELTSKRAEVWRELRLKLFYFTQQVQSEVLH